MYLQKVWTHSGTWQERMHVVQHQLDCLSLSLSSAPLAVGASCPLPGSFSYSDENGSTNCSSDLHSITSPHQE